MANEKWMTFTNQDNSTNPTTPGGASSNTQESKYYISILKYIPS